ncbi:proline dehydrogenase [Streptomyces sp. NBC_01310]|uniref:proline dehydrogenase n=1 Tax=Streptomyces sp. NBC_01310 TaxID=2903820 RepID=UPI0035B5E70C|nr:proline dehydrogenase [Streptomyces sp. NBC_01310]
MDSGLAALVGAAIGSAASLGAALVSGRVQARSQHVQWRRQVRREAYTQYLTALHDRDVALDEVLRALGPDAHPPHAVEERVREFVRLARQVHRSAEVVLLEGPASVAEAVSGISEASVALSEVMRTMVACAREGDSSRHSEDSALAAERSAVLWDAVGRFRHAGREVLDGAGARRRPRTVPSG